MNSRVIQRSESVAHNHEVAGSNPAPATIHGAMIYDEPPQADQRSQEEWWASALNGRIYADSTRIIIQSRLHEKDNPGITLSGDSWPWLRMPT